MQALSHSAREHDDFRAVIQQFLHISDLNARLVTGCCLAPVPFARATGEKLCILVGFSFALDFKPTPGNAIDPRRTIAGLNCCCHSERREESRISIYTDLQTKTARGLSPST